MKKTLVVLLVFAMVACCLPLSVIAAPNNTKVEISGINTRPVLDGVINEGEYGEKIHSVDYNSDQFIDEYDPDHLINGDFYAAWDYYGLYLAWNVFTDIHHQPNAGQDMWMYCCIQIMTIGSNPADGDDSTYSEIGVGVTNEGESEKTYWIANYGTDQWDFKGLRHEEDKITTYEVFLPWDYIGLEDDPGEGTMIGLSYAIANQLDHNVTACMTEWQDCIIGGKDRLGVGVLYLTNPPAGSVDDIFAPIKTAEYNNSTVLVNGEKTAFEAYTIDGYNYFKLRDIAYAVNGTEKQFEVTWDEAKNAINLISTTPYTAVGGELTTGDGANKNAKVSTATIYKDGEIVNLEAYEIDGYNYFKLRDLAAAFDIGVTWDDATSTIGIDTTIGYVAP